MADNSHKAGFVSIVGKPNVGKSTLMNAMVGEKISIITSKAQTTRHRIMGIVKYRNADIFDLTAQREAEQHDLYHGQTEQDQQRTTVAEYVIEFFAYEYQ